MCQDQGGRYVSLASSRDSGSGHSDEPVVSAKFRGGNPSKRTGRHPLALERDNPIEKVRVNRTARSLTSAPGPTLPTRALRQVGSYQGYTSSCQRSRNGSPCDPNRPSRLLRTLRCSTQQFLFE